VRQPQCLCFADRAHADRERWLPPGSPARARLRACLANVLRACGVILGPLRSIAQEDELPEGFKERNSWQRATELLMGGALREGDINAATEAIERAGFMPTFTASQVGAALWRSSPDASLFSVPLLAYLL
jgi:hypothetical protein